MESGRYTPDEDGGNVMNREKTQVVATDHPQVSCAEPVGSLDSCGKRLRARSEGVTELAHFLDRRPETSNIG